MIACVASATENQILVKPNKRCPHIIYRDILKTCPGDRAKHGSVAKLGIDGCKAAGLPIANEKNNL